jgi:4-alpha-glucanotransferase
MKRSSGILLHVSSLPNDYGIGSFGKSAYEFVDFLVETGQSYWQILPLTTTSYGDSPYQSFSAFAGNTHFIDLELLVEDGYLKESDIVDIDFGENPVKVDYQQVFNNRRPILEKAVKNFTQSKASESPAYTRFISENKEWLKPFVEYMTVKEEFELKPWYEWPEEFKYFDEKRVTEFMAEREEIALYHVVTQYWFFQQWFDLKKYANDQNIQIIGDIPIYVSRDSVEMWQTPKLFKVDENLDPTGVAGVPPDKFSDEGQYWGNPLYDWEYMRNNDYKWWIWRIEESFRLYDMVRIDHFRGFESYWEVPFGSPTAASGSWKKGPAEDLFKAIEKELGDLNIIAEDLGFITEEVIEMREATGFPGMKILENGFDDGEDSEDLPHHYYPETVAYVGTHDNPTGLDWYLNNLDLNQRDRVDLYLNRKPGEHIADALIRGIASSSSSIVIYTLQDLLRLGEEGRMNIPSTIGDNWDWRMRSDSITNDLTERLRLLTETYFRVNGVESELKVQDETIKQSHQELKEETDNGKETSK